VYLGVTYMSIRRIMKSKLIIATPQMQLHRAVALLIEHKISGLPVVDDSNTIVGVITEADLIRTCAEPHRTFRTVGELMTPNPFMIWVNAPLVDVFDCLMTHSFRRVLIHDKRKLVGLVSRADVMPDILQDLLEDLAIAGAQPVMA
jgi:CBS domain-containing protein